MTFGLEDARRRLANAVTMAKAQIVGEFADMLLDAFQAVRDDGITEIPVDNLISVVTEAKIKYQTRLLQKVKP